VSTSTAEEFREEVAGTDRIFWRRGAAFVLLLGGLWLALAAADRALPFVKPGHDQIYLLAVDTVQRGVVFPVGVERTRVAIFGDSRVQAGFQPFLFDQLSTAETYSFNLGLPNDTRFLHVLQTLIERDQAPDVVLLTLPWTLDAEPTRWALLSDDAAFVETVLPFRQFFRNVTLFLIRSASRGGPVAYYRAAQANVDGARRDRGYFFVEGMSHFPGHRLPEDFRLDGDLADRPTPREIPLDGPAFEEMLRLRDAAGFRVVLVPTYARLGSRAPSEADARVRDALGGQGIEVRGPDYWLYPNGYFSDPGHVNREGAATYTRDLWELLAPVIRAAPRSRATATG
jgi:hypothetical protein